MANVMAILQDVDKCMRCNGCVISCKRTWNLKADDPGKHTVSPDQRVCIKSQKKADMGPFLRYSCWHCPDPPCAPECPFKAIAKQANGAVSVDWTLCKPNQCVAFDVAGRYPCAVGCQRGGYPKPGTGVADQPSTPLMNKCTLCWGKAGADNGTGTQLPTRASKDAGGNFISPISGGVVPELAHEPACVYTCPAKAMKWDTRANILTYLQTAANGFILADGTHNWAGNGSMYWASKGPSKIVGPKADPFVEDHLIPSAGSVPMLGVLPVLAVGGLLAYSARRSRMEEATEGGEE